MARTLHQYHQLGRRPSLHLAVGPPSARFGGLQQERPAAIIAAARRLNRSAGIIAISALIDSAMEHYRGNFHNKAMWTPIVTSLSSMAVSAHGLADGRRRAHPVRDAVYSAAGFVGIVGTGFHIYNVTKKVGGFNLQNLFYSAPLSAPAAMSLSGLMRFLAEGYATTALKENRGYSAYRQVGWSRRRQASHFSALRQKQVCSISAAPSTTRQCSFP